MANSILKGLRKFAPIWQDAKDKDLNEADVVTRIVKFLEDVLGYDVLSHVTKEFQVKERFVDLAIRVNSKVEFYIEVKSANTNLKESQIFQAESYASQSGVSWVVLTNGGEWQIYHLTFDKTGIEHTLIAKIDLIGGDLEQSATKLYYLSFEAIKKNELGKYWETCLSLKPASMLKALFHEDTLATIRREIRRRSGVLISEDDLLEGIQKLLSPTIVAQHGDSIKISRKRRMAKKSGNDSPVVDTTLVQDAEGIPQLGEIAPVAEEKVAEPGPSTEPNI